MNDRPAPSFPHPEFVSPWSLRAFGLTLAISEKGVFSLQEFQQALIEQIERYEATQGSIDSEACYYDRWIEALTALLSRKGLLQERLANHEQAVREALDALRHEHEQDADGPLVPTPVYQEAGQ